MHGAAGNLSAWSISVFSQGSNKRVASHPLDVPNVWGTFAPMGAADPRVKSNVTVHLSSTRPPVDSAWIPISGGVVVVLRTYPLPFGGFFKPAGEAGLTPSNDLLSHRLLTSTSFHYPDVGMRHVAAPPGLLFWRLLLLPVSLLLLRLLLLHLCCCGCCSCCCC
jgi:hypothetical protein